MATAHAEAEARPLAADSEPVERLRTALAQLVAADKPIGVAVSGGPDSLALLLLAAAARPGAVEAATVDHKLRPESAGEAAMVARLCAGLGVPHRILAVEWAEKPATGLQERARAERYRLLGEWADERGLGTLVTAHHLDDQAETFLMRLTRGAGVRGLGAMRRIGRAPAGRIALARPLLGWRRSELEAVCTAAAVTPVEDPSNADPQFERTRIRAALAGADWLDPVAVAASADHVAQAEDALEWATAQVWRLAVTRDGEQLLFRPRGMPREMRRRVIARAVVQLASEGAGAPLRGREIEQLLAAMNAGGRATLRGVLCSGGDQWRFEPAPARAA